jgi:hypothetical protein
MPLLPTAPKMPTVCVPPESSSIGSLSVASMPCVVHIPIAVVEVVAALVEDKTAARAIWRGPCRWAGFAGIDQMFAPRSGGCNTHSTGWPTTAVPSPEGPAAGAMIFVYKLPFNRSGSFERLRGDVANVIGLGNPRQRPSESRRCGWTPVPPESHDEGRGFRTVGARADRAASRSSDAP